MGQKLMQYYKYMADEAGLPGKLKLAQATRIPSAKAALEPDSAENLEAFRNAITKLTGKDAPKL